MVFSSITFLALFLPLVLAGYFLFSRSVFLDFWRDSRWLAANFFLLIASLLFYAWGEGSQVWILIASCLGNFVLAELMMWRAPVSGERKGAQWLGLERVAGLQPGESRTRSQKILLVAAIVLNIGMLAYFKYANFFVDTLTPIFLAGGVLEGWVRVALPLGISFFTFQALSYVIDVYRGETRPAKSLIEFSCFLTMFPQLVAGPIVRYQDIAKQLTVRSLSRRQFASGIQRFILGLSKKVLIANTVAVIADKAFALGPWKLTPLTAWLGIVCYTLQIYYDFSGYSDMAIGLGRMFGFEFRENFNYPYSARSMHDFWRRWHISLSTWFRDYLYRPLGGGRKGFWRTYFNLAIVFLLCGLWHGASWLFVAWGMYHGCFLILERMLTQDRKNEPGTRSGWNRLVPCLGRMYLLLVVMLGWVFFRSTSFSQAWGYFLALFGQGQGSGGANAIRWFYFAWDVKIAMIAGIFFSTPVFPVLTRMWTARFSRQEMSDRASNDWIVGMMEWGRTAVLLGLLLLCFLPLASGTHNPFIYFRF